MLKSKIFTDEVNDQVKKQFYHMNGVCVLTVKSTASGDRVQCSLLRDGSLSRHLHIQANFSLLSICNRYSVRLIFWRLGKHLLSIQP